MKKIYIILSVLKDWFTSRITVTLTVIDVFVLSFVTMFFVTTKVSAEYLEDTETEKHYYNELVIDEERVPDAYEKLDHLLDDGFYSRWLAMALPPLSDNAYVDGYIKYSQLNDKPLKATDFIDLKCAPVFSGQEQERLAPIKNLLGYDYEITAGRDITGDDLVSRNAVAVAPEGWALSVGDRISCFGHELEIIGLNKPDKYNRRRDECILVPYWFLNECMQDELDMELVLELKQNSAYEGKPENNVYAPDEADDPIYTAGQIPFGDERVYPAFLRLEFSSFMFEERLDDGQKDDLAEFLGITPDDFTNSYDMFYFEQVRAFNDRAFKECLIAGLFCILNVLMITVFLCGSNVRAYRIFRVYGCSRIAIFVMNLICLAVIVGLSLGISVMLCSPAAALFGKINSTYEFRQECVDISVRIFAAVSFAACIPAAIKATMRAPAGGK
ncbi:MAG: hypothetical protein IJ555_13915 [Ruminococcus sp.]|nr:hypothetical protein [Ruminococcus sp.]